MVIVGLPVEKGSSRVSRCLWENWGPSENLLTDQMKVIIVKLCLTDTWHPKQQSFNGCLVKHLFFHVMIWNRPIETPIWKRMFRVPGTC